MYSSPLWGFSLSAACGVSSDSFSLMRFGAVSESGEPLTCSKCQQTCNPPAAYANGDGHPFVRTLRRTAAPSS